MATGLAVITDVVTPAASSLLTTLARVKDDWQISGTSDDAFLTRVIARCSAEIANYCNREFGYRVLRDTVFPARDSYMYQLPGGLDVLQLSAWPVVSVTSIVEDGTTLDAATQYLLRGDVGQVLRLGSFSTPGTWPAVKIVATFATGYQLPGDGATTGVEPLPLAIEDATSRLTWARYAARRRDPFLRQETTEGVGSNTYWIPAGDSGALSPDIADLIDNYRVPVAA